MTKFCCIGHITRDRIITQEPPQTILCSGGSAYYIAWAIKALPNKVDFHLITSVSSEMMPEVDKLREANIRVTAYESPTNVFFENKYSANMDNRTQRVFSKSTPFTLEQLKNEDANIFHLGTLLADDFAPEIVEYLATKGDVSIDAQGYLREVVGQQVKAAEWRDKLRLLKHTTILKLNDLECQTLTGISEPHEAAEQIQEWGVREVIVTLRGGGSIIFADNHFYETPAYLPSKLVDATGCGDTYSAGYIYARELGMDYDERGKFATAMCTLKLEHIGPFSHHIEDVYQLIKKNQ